MDMSNGNDTAERLEGWSDLASMVLLGFALAAGDLTPKRPVWGRSRVHVAAIIVTMFALTAWTGFRFVYEGITTTAPREFLAGSVVYLARWFYLMLRISYPRFKEARMFRVARALREVNNLRVGKSSEPRNSTNNNSAQDTWQRNIGVVAGTGAPRPRRHRELEVVLRKGVQKATDHSRPYWRGFIDPAPTWYADEEAWDVNLLEERMHNHKLDVFGTTEFIKEDDITETAYSRFYNVVLTAIATPTTRRQPAPTQPAANASGSGTAAMQEMQTAMLQLQTAMQQMQAQHSASTQPPTQQQQQQRQLPHIEVDFTSFTNQWGGLPVEFIARRVDATDDRPIGKVARRIAADAVGYVNNQRRDFRTALQVTSLNECLELARRAHFTALRNTSGGNNAGT